MENYETTYETFWKHVVENPDGTLNVDQVKRELSDMHHMIEQVPIVYSHVTGGMLSKPNYYARGVIDAADEYMEQLIEERIEDFIHEWGLEDPRKEN